MMSKHSEGQHSRRLHRIVPNANGNQCQVGSAEEPSLNSDWQPGQVEQTNSHHQIHHATNGTKPGKEISGGKKEAFRLADNKPSSFIDQHSTVRSTNQSYRTSTHESMGHNIEPAKPRKPVNVGLRESTSVTDLSTYMSHLPNPGIHAYETREAHEKTHYYGMNQTDHLIEELEDTREQLKQSLEDNARLRTEVNHLADELYKFKIAQMAEQNGTAVGTEISLVQGSGQSQLLINGKPYYEQCEMSIVRSREALESQLKILQDQINKLEQHLEMHKSECQTTAAQSSEFSTSVMKCLCEMTTLQKAIQETSKDCFAKTQMALKSKSVENEQLGRLVQEYKTEMDTLVQQVNATMEEEWSELQEKRDQLEVERERLSQKPIMELKTQIIQLRCGYEQKITKLQEETKKLGEDNAALEHKYTDLRDKFDVKPEQAIGEQSVSKMEHALETKCQNNSAGNQEGKTTRLERVVNEIQLDMQMMVANNEKLCEKVQQSLQSRASPSSAHERSPSPSPVTVVKLTSQNLDEGNKNEHGDDTSFDPNLVCLGCRKLFQISEIKKHYFEDCPMRQNEQDPIQMNSVIPARQTMAGDTPPFIPIIPSMKMNEVMPEPKLLYRTPGCSFKGYEDLGGLCPDCSGQGNS